MAVRQCHTCVSVQMFDVSSAITAEILVERWRLRRIFASVKAQGLTYLVSIKSAFLKTHLSGNKFNFRWQKLFEIKRNSHGIFAFVRYQGFFTILVLIERIFWDAFLHLQITSRQWWLPENSIKINKNLKAFCLYMFWKPINFRGDWIHENEIDGEVGLT